MAAKQGSIVERVIHRLVRKHISGPTMGSAIARAKEYNKKGMPVSINFISSAPQDKARANYNTTTYMQLAREIARMGIKATVHLKLEQLGSGLEREYAARNLDSILAVARKAGVFVWCELTDPFSETLLLEHVHDGKGMGVAVHSLEEAIRYAKANKAIKELKIMLGKKELDGKHEKTEPIESITKSLRSVVLNSPNEGLASKLSKKGTKYRSSLILEFQLGYGEKKLGKMAKKGSRISVVIPFGKDWASYAMTNVPEGYTRALANRLLHEGMGD
ncbi:MAG: hypothetical protein KGH49_03955 [Candidatus Micrarchaeota archaeon]|nr:hypothetical protein [Candidatus Micrarchaeota archaeon]